MEKRLHKSSTDKALAGVCGGIAEYFGIDSVIIRLLFVLLALGAGSGLLIYIVCAIVMPDERKAAEQASYTYTDYNGSTTYSSSTSADSSGDYTNTDNFYQDRAANNDYSYYSGSTNQNTGHERRQLNKHQGFGVVLVVVAGFILLRYFIPRIPDAIMMAAFLLLIGLYLIFRKR